jgi:hypothetical protein
MSASTSAKSTARCTWNSTKMWWRVGRVSYNCGWTNMYHNYLETTRRSHESGKSPAYHVSVSLLFDLASYTSAMNLTTSPLSWCIASQNSKMIEYRIAQRPLNENDN